MGNFKIFGIFFLFLFVFYSCTTTSGSDYSFKDHKYGSDLVDQPSGAVLIGPFVTIRAIDGEKIIIPQLSRIRVTPGTHSFEYSYFEEQGSSYLTGSGTINILIKESKSYVIIREKGKYIYNIVYKEIDEEFCVKIGPCTGQGYSSGIKNAAFLTGTSNVLYSPDGKNITPTAFPKDLTLKKIKLNGKDIIKIINGFEPNQLICLDKKGLLSLVNEKEGTIIREVQLSSVPRTISCSPKNVFVFFDEGKLQVLDQQFAETKSITTMVKPELVAACGNIVVFAQGKEASVYSGDASAYKLFNAEKDIINLAVDEKFGVIAIQTSDNKIIFVRLSDWKVADLNNFIYPDFRSFAILIGFSRDQDYFYAHLSNTQTLVWKFSDFNWDQPVKKYNSYFGASFAISYSAILYGSYSDFDMDFSHNIYAYRIYDRGVGMLFTNSLNTTDPVVME